MTRVDRFGRRQRYRQRGDRDLSPMELDVLRLIAQDKRDQEIALALGISYRSVVQHIQKIRQRLGIDVGRVGLARLWDQHERGDIHLDRNG